MYFNLPAFITEQSIRPVRVFPGIIKMEGGKHKDRFPDLGRVLDYFES